MAVSVHSVKEGSTIKRLFTKKRRVVVTGLGVVSPLGHDADEYYTNLLEGTSGVSQIEAFDCTEFPTVNLRSSYFNYCFFFPGEVI